MGQASAVNQPPGRSVDPPDSLSPLPETDFLKIFADVTGVLGRFGVSTRGWGLLVTRKNSHFPWSDVGAVSPSVAWHLNVRPYLLGTSTPLQQNLATTQPPTYSRPTI